MDAKLMEAILIRQYYEEGYRVVGGKILSPEGRALKRYGGPEISWPYTSKLCRVGTGQSYTEIDNFSRYERQRQLGLEFPEDFDQEFVTVPTGTYG